MKTLRIVLFGAWLHTKQASRSLSEILLQVLIPVVQATLALYLFKASGQHPPLLQAAVGAGLMGVWSSVLFGSGSAIGMQRWQGTLEMLMLAPVHPVLSLLAITVSTAVTGVYAMVATLGWGWLFFGVPLEFASPGGFVVALLVCVAGLGMFGLLLASAFVLLPNANALNNLLEYPIWLISGMLVPLSVLPDWTGGLAALLPTTWGSRAVHESVAGGGIWAPVGLCAATSVACLGIAAVAIKHFEYRARVRATLSLA